MSSEKKTPRKQEILQTIAYQLESQPGVPIRTASLAKAIGISEAALYRHFPSKAKMFEALIQFAEDTIFSRINLIQKEQQSVFVRCEATTHLLLTFADRNPGIISILTGNAIMGENEKLRIRVNQLFDRLETQLKQFLREGVIHGELTTNTDISMLANLLSTHITGKIAQFHRSEYKISPLIHSEQQWVLLVQLLKNS